MKKENKGIATISTPEQLKETYSVESLSIANTVASKSREVSRLVLDLPKMSKTLYGTERYSTQTRNWVGDLLWFLALVLVAVFEIPTNSGGFEIFGRTQTQTTAMAVAFGLITAVLAHFTGYFLKRGAAGVRHGQGNGGFIWGFICFAVAIAMFWFIAGFRVAYMKNMGFEQEISQFTQAFFAVGIFFVGVIASYFHTSGVKDLQLEKTFRSDLKSLKKLKAEIAELNKKKKVLDTNHVANVENAKKAIEAKQKEESQAKENENNQKKNEFNALYEQFQASYKVAQEISKVTSDKSNLPTNADFMQALSTMDLIVEEMEETKTWKEFLGGGEKMNEVRQKLAEVKKIVNLTKSN
ncbi:MAG: hypothetical protein V4665_04750 [Patescibacteria group bacterium]